MLIIGLKKKARGGGQVCSRENESFKSSGGEGEGSSKGKKVGRRLHLSGPIPTKFRKRSLTGWSLNGGSSREETDVEM